jgi:hypothetical protein
MAARTGPGSRGLLIVAVLSVVFGLVEIATAFTHNFAGVSTSIGFASSYSTAAVGSTYAIAGLFLLTMKRWGASIAVFFYIVDVVGRATLVTFGYFPVDSSENVIAIVLGTGIAAVFGLYTIMKRKSLP